MAAQGAAPRSVLVRGGIAWGVRSADAENGVPEVADDLVQLIDAEPDAAGGPVSVHQLQRGLKH